MLTATQEQFLQDYTDLYAGLESAARAARLFFLELLSQEDYEIHVVDARAKEPESVRLKILEKGYEDPAVELTDQIGVRIITYYGEQVDRIASVIRSRLHVDDEKSVDKRRELRNAEFGYRSVHLVARLKNPHLRDSRFEPLRAMWFEIQVRSVLDHAWAEIEHEIVYKSGTLYSDDFRRRFHAVAGTLEVLEQEFLRLRAEQDQLINRHRDAYTAGREKAKPLDAARLLALLEVHFPEGKGWRKALRVGDPFGAHTEKIAIQALASVGVTTGKQLLTLFERVEFRSKLDAYAASLGIPPAEAAHLPLVALAVAIKDRRALRSYFPDLADSSPFVTALG